MGSFLSKPNKTTSTPTVTISSEPAAPSAITTDHHKEPVTSESGHNEAVTSESGHNDAVTSESGHKEPVPSTTDRLILDHDTVDWAGTSLPIIVEEKTIMSLHHPSRVDVTPECQNDAAHCQTPALSTIMLRASNVEDGQTPAVSVATLRAINNEDPIERQPTSESTFENKSVLELKTHLGETVKIEVEGPSEEKIDEEPGISKAVDATDEEKAEQNSHASEVEQNATDGVLAEAVCEREDTTAEATSKHDTHLPTDTTELNPAE